MYLWNWYIEGAPGDASFYVRTEEGYEYELKSLQSPYPIISSSLSMYIRLKAPMSSVDLIEFAYSKDPTVLTCKYLIFPSWIQIYTVTSLMYDIKPSLGFKQKNS